MPEPTSPEIDRRRPGRFRRWLLRPAVWALVALVVLLFGVQLGLRSQWAHERIRRTLEAELTAALDRPVTVGAALLTVVPAALEVEDLVIAGPAAEDLPFLRLPRARVDFDLRALLERRVHVERVMLERPYLQLAFLADGADNLIRPRAGDGSGGTFEVVVDRLRVTDAEVAFWHQPMRLSLDADDVVAEMRSEGSGVLQGQVKGEALALSLPGWERDLRFAAAGSVSAERLSLDEVWVEGEGLSLDATGVCSYMPSRCEVRVDGDASAAALADLTRGELAGEVAVDGTFSWRDGRWQLDGQADVPRLRVADRRIADLSGTLFADDDGVRLTLDGARHAGGSLGGTVSWHAADPDQPFDLDLTLSDLRLANLLDDAGIDLAGLDARVNGRVRYRFPLDRAYDGDGGGTLSLARLAADGRQNGVVFDDPWSALSLEGTVPLRIAEGVVRLDALALQAPTQSVLADGWYRLRDHEGSFDFEVATLDVAELAGLIPLPEGEDPLWRPTTGEGRLIGTLGVVGASLDCALSLDLEGVSAAGMLRPQRVSGTMRVSGQAVEEMRLEIGQDGAALLIGGRVAFGAVPAPGTVAAGPSTWLSLDAVEWPLEDARPWLTFPLPLDGRISGRLALTAEPDGLGGWLDAAVADAKLRLDDGRRLMLQHATTRLDFSPAGVEIERMEFIAAAGSISGRGQVDLATGALGLTVEGADLDLRDAPFDQVVPAGLEGRGSIDATVGGSLDRPTLVARLEAADLRLGEDLRAAGHVAVRWDGTEIEAEGKLAELLAFSGGGRFDGETADVTLAIEGRSLATLATLDPRIPPGLDGALGGSLRVAGRVAGADAEPPTVELSLDRLTLSLEERRLENLEPVVVRWWPDGLEVASMYLGAPEGDSDLFAIGSVGTDGELDLRVQSRLAATWLRLVVPGFEVDGTVDLLGRVRGPVGAPYFDGQGALRQGRALLPSAFPHTLEAIDGVVLFYRDALVLDHLAAEVAGGQVQASGRSGIPWGDTPLDYDVRVSARGFNLRYPEDWQLAGDVDLTLMSDDDGACLVSGHADLGRASYQADLPVGFDQVLRRVFARRRLEVEATDDLLSAIKLNVVVDVPEGVRVRNNLADLEGRAELVVRGSAARPLVFGTVDIDAGSKLVYNSTDYEVERGRLTFADATRLDPEVDLVARTRVREFDVRLSLSGTLERLDTRISSEPPLPDVEVFRLLATGEVADSVAGTVVRDLTGTDEATAASVASFVYGQAASVVGDRFNNLFGFDKFRIDPLTGSGDALSKARVTVGKRLSKDVFVTYSVDPSSTEQQRLQVEWQISRNLVLVLVQNGDDSYAADARWEQSF